jgi:ribosomal protein S18 acetylase RimI-like enzyme
MNADPKMYEPDVGLTKFREADDGSGITVREAEFSELSGIVALDAKITGFARLDFWNDLVRQAPGRGSPCILVARSADTIIGYAVGEIRSWPVRAPACGWLYAIGVDKEFRQRKVASALLTELIARFKKLGVTAIRTVIDVDDYLLLSFLRSFGMSAGPFVELEMTFPADELKLDSAQERR